MEYIDKLGEDNSHEIDRLLGHSYTLESGEDTLTTNQVLDANETLAESLYGREVAGFVRNNNTAALDDMRREVIDAVSVTKTSLNSIDMSRLGMVVVRPEALGLTDMSRQLLARNGLKVALDKTTRINFEQYWSLYGPGLRDPNATYDFPTRTLNYINKDIRVLVVTDSAGHLGSYPVSEYMTEHLKGSQGSYSPGTLRGDIAYTALRSLMSDVGDSFITPQANVALDPIGAYRQLVRGNIASDRMHASADAPLLFYAGQSMHMPDSTEISRDMRVLLTEDEIAKIAEELTR